MRIIKGCFFLLVLVAFQAHSQSTVQRWDRFEVQLKGPQTGNPFVDVTLAAEFINGNERVLVNGFYDGNGQYLLRFMPSKTGSGNTKPLAITRFYTVRPGHLFVQRLRTITMVR